jgi:phage gp45-like
MNILSRIKNLINICKVTTFQSGNWKVSLLDGEVMSNVQYAQPFGMKTRPPVGSKGVLLARGGQKSGGFLIVLEDDSGAPDVAEGETAIFNDHGATIHLKADGSIEVDGGDFVIKGGNCVIEAGDLDASGDVSADGDVTDNSGTPAPTMALMRTVFNSHTHTGNLGNPTSTPTGAGM